MSPFPQDVAFEILPYLSLYDGISLSNLCHDFRSMQEQATFWIILLEHTREFRPLPCHPCKVLANMDIQSLKDLAVKAMQVGRNFSQAHPQIVGSILRQHLTDNNTRIEITFHVPGTSLVVLTYRPLDRHRDEQEMLCYDFSSQRILCSISVDSRFEGFWDHCITRLRVLPTMCKTYRFDIYSDGVYITILTLRHSRDFDPASIRLVESESHIEGQFSSGCLDPSMSIVALEVDRGYLDEQDIMTIQLTHRSSRNTHTMDISGCSKGRQKEAMLFFHKQHLHVIVQHKDNLIRPQYFTIEIGHLTFLEARTSTTLHVEPVPLRDLPNSIQHFWINTYTNTINFLYSEFGRDGSALSLYTFPIQHCDAHHPRTSSSHTSYELAKVIFFNSPRDFISAYGSGAFLMRNDSELGLGYSVDPGAPRQIEDDSESKGLTITALQYEYESEEICAEVLDAGQGLILGSDPEDNGYLLVASWV